MRIVCRATASSGDFAQEYLTIELTHKLYPNLICEGTSVPTIANHALLVSYAWPENSERYRRIARFVNEFFGKTDQFNNGARHPNGRNSMSEPTFRADPLQAAANWIAAHEPRGCTQ